MDIGLLTTCAVGGVAWGAGFAAGFKAAGKKEHEADVFAAPFGEVLPVCFHVLPGVAGELVGAGVDACGGVAVHVAGGGAGGALPGVCVYGASVASVCADG